MNKIFTNLLKEKANVVIILALAFSTLLGFTALVYAQRNGINTTSNFTVEFSPDNKQISVNITKNVNLFFAKSMGINSSNVTGRAVAKIAPIRRVRGIIPVGLDESLLPLSVGQQYTIKVGSMDITTGWTGILEYPGQSGSDDYRNSAEFGYPESIEVGDLVSKASGNKSGPTIQGNHVQGSQPADKIRIIGFASVFLEQVVGNGNANEIKVRYINHTVLGDTDDSLTNSHLNGVRLVE